jgi:tetratricopeptide (TPR) repeat protein
MKNLKQLPRLMLTLLLGMVIGGCGLERAESNRMVARALALDAQNELGRAGEELRAAIHRDPSNALAHHYLGYLELQRRGAPQRAADAFEAAVAAGGDWAELHYLHGVALSRLERTSEAQQAHERAVAAHPGHARAWYRLGEILEGRGEIRDAVDHYTRAIWNDPRSPLAYGALASIYGRYGRPREAMLVLRNAIDNENPRDESMRVHHAQNRADLGRFALELGELDASIAALQQAAAMRGTSEVMVFNLAVALRQRWERDGRAEDRLSALHHFEQAGQRCSPERTQALCESIVATLRELRSAPASP